MNKTGKNRRYWQFGFMLLFLLAPVLDIFRLDLTLNHFIFFGQAWTLGLAPDMSAQQVSLQLLLYVFIPALSVIAIGGYIAWRWGRLYCGWLCPHFSAVEIINNLMRRTTGKLSIWDDKPAPEQQCDGTQITPNKNNALFTAIAIFGFSFLWALTALTYLLPPTEIYSNLIHAELTRNQMLFLAVLTTLLMIEFTFARHLFCQYVCAVGIAQSLLWMGNKRAMVVGFNRSRVKACVDCDASCEHACPMRLKPRSIKRKIITCTQCMECINACERVQSVHSQPSLLQLLEHDCALDASMRDFGKKPTIPSNCFKE